MKKVLTMMAVAAFFAMSATACGGEDKADEAKDGEKTEEKAPEAH